MSVPNIEVMSEMSRKRVRSVSEDERCVGGCGNPSCDPKRASGVDSTDKGVKWWYIKLESESEPFDSDEPDSLKNESLWSVQLRETDTVQDSSDSEFQWRRAHDNELEVASLDSEDEIKPFTCSSDDDGCSSVEDLVIATVAPDVITIDYFADSSSNLGSSDESSDPELQPQDKWACLRCKHPNQPIPRYCQHCFAVRKKWFPPRPRGRKKRKSASLATFTIPPQIQITPTFSIPDLSAMKGDPYADNVMRSYEESVARFTSLTEEQKLAQIQEKLRRHKMIRLHSQMQRTEVFNTGDMLEVGNKLKSLMATKSLMLQKYMEPAISAERPLNTGSNSNLKTKEYVKPPASNSSSCTVDTLPMDKEESSLRARNVASLEKLDFQTKVAEYLNKCEVPGIDTPPSSQNTDFSLEADKAEPKSESDPLDEDVVDFPFRPPPPPDQVASSTAEDEEAATKLTSNSYSSMSSAASKMCSFCAVKEADTAFIHVRKGHLCACYPCARRVYASKGQCPICQRQASKICKIFT